MTDVLAHIDLSGAPLNANAPSKEYPFHLAIYRSREDAKAVVHLHSTYSVALSCLESLNPEEPLPAITPYWSPGRIVAYPETTATALVQ